MSLSGSCAGRPCPPQTRLFEALACLPARRIYTDAYVQHLLRCPLIEHDGMHSSRSLPTYAHEAALRELGYTSVAGIDEAGRGALAGPVVAAAVILDEQRIPDGVRDSKLVSEAEREQLYARVVEAAIAWSVGVVDSVEIDRMNILRATFAAMIAAAGSLAPRPDYLLIDGRDVVDAGCECRAIIGGDATCVSIAAASIVAKVTRDRIMRRLHEDAPYYGWNRNKGYGTADHRRAILSHGWHDAHRTTFLGKLLQGRLDFQ